MVPWGTVVTGTRRLRAETSRNYLIEGSTKLMTWTSLTTNVPPAAALRCTDAESKRLPYCFYRASPLL